MKQCVQCYNFFTDSSETCPNDNTRLTEFEITNLIGQTIDGKYQVEEILGKGGMGAVFRCRHTFIKNTLAIKVIHPELALNQSIVKRFLREARAAATIDHPNAIRVSDFGRVGDLLYLVMEFVQGISLKEYLKKKQQLSIKETASIMRQICEALDTAHSHQIVHRDLKPDNIMLKSGAREDLIVKVVDFGIAKVYSTTDSQSEEAHTEQITNVGQIIGTASYMSPEQCQAAAVDHRADIYSLGVIAFQALTGKLPFTAPAPMQVIIKHITEAPPSMRGINPAIPEKLEKIVLRALEKNPALRYFSAGEFAAELSAIADALPTASSAPHVSGNYLINQSNRAPVAANPINNSEMGDTASEVNNMPSNPAYNARASQPSAADSTGIFGKLPAVTRSLPSDMPRAKLLVVNDSKAIVMLLKHQLQQAGYEVIALTESLTAADTILKQRPDIVIVGIEMPQLSGPDLCIIIRTNPTFAAVARIPIFLYSSLSEEELAKRVKECGASGYIHKNWNMDKLTGQLSQFLTSHRSA